MKKLNLVVGVLVTAALAALVVLFVMTFFVDETAIKPEASSTPPVSTATPTPTEDIQTTPTPQEDIQTSPVGEPLDGERVQIDALLGMEYLTVINNSDLYTTIPLGTGAQFFLKSDASTGTFVEIVFVEDDLELRKPSLLDAYVPDFEQMNMLGQVSIPGTELLAEGLMATNEADNHAEAWLIDCEFGFFAIVIGYSDDDSRDELYRMIATIEFSM